MAYNGYLLKIGNYRVPDKYVKADTYKAYVNMQDIDDWTDANGYLHRNAIDLKAIKIEFETPPMMTNVTFEAFMSNIRANYTNTVGRECMINAYIPESDSYVTQKCYMVDIQPQIYGTYNGVITYDSIRFSFVGGVA